MLMARPYSDDLRRKLLEAYDQGNGTLAELAEQFCVSVAWAWKVSSSRKRTGTAERPTYRPGRKRQIDEQAVAELLRARPDTTLPELQVELESKSGLRFSTQHLWRVLKRMGFRLKKSHSTPKNGIQKRTASDANSSSQPSAPSLRRS
jgi:transposase